MPRVSPQDGRPGTGGQGRENFFSLCCWPVSCGEGSLLSFDGDGEGRLGLVCLGVSREEDGPQADTMSRGVGGGSGADVALEMASREQMGPGLRMPTRGGSKGFFTVLPAAPQWRRGSSRERTGT